MIIFQDEYDKWVWQMLRTQMLLTPTYVNNARETNSIHNQIYALFGWFKKVMGRLKTLEGKVDRAVDLLSGSGKKGKNTFTIQTRRAPMPTEEEFADKEDTYADAADELIAGEVSLSRDIQNFKSHILVNFFSLVSPRFPRGFGPLLLRRRCVGSPLLIQDERPPPALKGRRERPKRIRLPSVPIQGHHDHGAASELLLWTQKVSPWISRISIPN